MLVQHHFVSKVDLEGQQLHLANGRSVPLPPAAQQALRSHGLQGSSGAHSSPLADRGSGPHTRTAGTAYHSALTSPASSRWISGYLCFGQQHVWWELLHARCHVNSGNVAVICLLPLSGRQGAASGSCVGGSAAPSPASSKRNACCHSQAVEGIREFMFGRPAERGAPRMHHCTTACLPVPCMTQVRLDCTIGQHPVRPPALDPGAQADMMPAQTLLQQVCSAALPAGLAVCQRSWPASGFICAEPSSCSVWPRPRLHASHRSLALRHLLLPAGIPCRLSNMFHVLQARQLRPWLPHTCPPRGWPQSSVPLPARSGQPTGPAWAPAGGAVGRGGPVPRLPPGSSQGGPQGQVRILKHMEKVPYDQSETASSHSDAGTWAEPDACMGWVSATWTACRLVPGRHGFDGRLSSWVSRAGSMHCHRGSALINLSEDTPHEVT